MPLDVLHLDTIHAVDLYYYKIKYENSTDNRSKQEYWL